MSISSFVEHALELLGSVGPVRARAMMGGYIISCGRLPFALIADDRLYLKVDAVTQPSFEAVGGEAFTYEARGKVVRMSYWSPPDGALDGPEMMSPWARLALEAAARARRVPRRLERRRSETAAARRRRGHAGRRRALSRG
ncbi:MAG TPA: TfoX/Sxy family protein [Anaeromyxobacteraceae bacterium]|jgi:DNA transformation protein|nr:TfoX/Sxy family protein [Anaeromyxobacteraceae bacterium]